MVMLDVPYEKKKKESLNLFFLRQQDYQYSSLLLSGLDVPPTTSSGQLTTCIPSPHQLLCLAVVHCVPATETGGL